MPVPHHNLRTQIARLPFLLFGLFLLSSVSYAYIPSPKDECEYRNSAICEIRGVQHVVAGECPQGAVVLRPPGKERCDELGEMDARREGTTIPESPVRVMPDNPSQHLKGMEPTPRWILPALVIATALIATGLVIWAMRWVWLKRKQGNVLFMGIATVFRYLISALCAGYAFYSVFGMVFLNIFDRYNHDSAGPAILAAPPALIASVAVALAVFFFTCWALEVVLDRYFKKNWGKKP
jgi:hypothetical protein